MAALDTVRFSRRKLLAGGLAAGAGVLLSSLPETASWAGRSWADRPEANVPPKPVVDGDLNLFTWEGYFVPSVVAAFEKHYGVTVTQTNIESGTESFSKLAAGLPFDCATSNSTQFPKLVPKGILRPLDWDYFKYGSQVLGFFHHPPYDPGASHSVPLYMAPYGLAYNSDHVSGVTGSWTDLWRLAPKLSRHAYMNDTEPIAIGIGLMSLGYTECSGVASQVDAAIKRLKALEPYIGGVASLNATQILADGTAWLAPCYTGNVYTALLKSKTPKSLHFELCKEGQLFNCTGMVIPAAAKHPGTAMLFIDWMLQPNNMAANVDYTAYPVPTIAGLAAYDKLVAKYPFLKFGTDLINKVSSWEKPLEGAREKLWNEAWTQVQF